MNEQNNTVVTWIEVIVSGVVYRFATLEEAKEFKREMMEQ